VGALGPYVQFAEGGDSGKVLWAATGTSLLRFEYDDPGPLRREFAAEVESLVRGGEPIAAGTAKLPYSRKPILARLATKRFDLGANVRFESRVVEFDPAWSEPSSARTATIPALGGGSYTIEVRAVDDEGNRSSVASRRFQVGSPWYFTWWAWALYALVAISTFQDCFAGVCGAPRPSSDGWND